MRALLDSMDVKLPRLLTCIQKIPSAPAPTLGGMRLVGAALVVQADSEHRVFAIHTTESQIVAMRIRQNFAPVAIHDEKVVIFLELPYEIADLGVTRCLPKAAADRVELRGTQAGPAALAEEARVLVLGDQLQELLD